MTTPLERGILEALVASLVRALDGELVVDVARLGTRSELVFEAEVCERALVWRIGLSRMPQRRVVRFIEADHPIVGGTRRVVLSAGAWRSLGRSPGCGLGFPDDAKWVSQRHAAVLAVGETVLLRDLGSLNGTFVNEARVEAGAVVALSTGDRITLGPPQHVDNPVLVLREDARATSNSPTSLGGGIASLHLAPAFARAISRRPSVAPLVHVGPIGEPRRLAVCAELSVPRGALAAIETGARLVPDATPLSRREGVFEGAVLLTDLATGRALGVGSFTADLDNDFELERWLTMQTPPTPVVVRHDDATNPAPDTAAMACAELPVAVRLVLAEVELTLDELFRMAPGSVLTLPALDEDDVSIVVGSRVVARGRLVDAGDGRVGVVVEDGGGP